MAANNYYGFTHAGTQYGNQYTPSGPGQGYATAQPYPPPAQPANVTQGPQAYAATPADAYVISGYTRPAQSATAAAQQGYYAQQSQQGGYAAQAGKVQPQAAPRPAATSTAYPTYTANTAGVSGSGTTSYAGFAQPQQQASSSKAPSFTNYDAAVYNAVTAYAQGSNTKGNNFGFKRQGGGGGPHMNKMKGPRPMQNKPQTLHYCDVCKISCAGPQTYKEHLEGQKHKKKEAAQKTTGTGTTAATGTPVVKGGSTGGLRCELCDVTCTGSDAYAAHIRGAKHQKVLKLHTKLGKPIPSDNPTVIPSATSNGNSQSSAGSGSAVANNSKPAPQKPHANSSFNKQANAGATPKISFIGPKADFDRYGQGQGQQQSDSGAASQSVPPPGQTQHAANNSQSTASSVSSNDGFVEKDIQPVGQDYIEEVRSDDGKVVSFNCKLCECRFNDPNAKEMHMKGRRHRLQYKKKVNPDLVVDVKPSSRQKKIEERRAQRTPQGRKSQGMGESFQRGPVPPLMPPGGGPRGFAPPGYGGPIGGPHMPPFMTPPMMRRPESMEDRHVMARHADIYPHEEELHAIQKIVSNTEKALKFVSDQFAETDAKKPQNGVKEEPGTGDSTAKSETDIQASRVLKGVMRVGHLAKGLLLRGDRNVKLVVLCSEKPTVTMLDRIVEALPKHLLSVAPEDKYTVTKKLDASGLIVSSDAEPKIDVIVTLTSPLVRTPAAEEAEAAAGEAQATQVKDAPDMLDKEKCLDALAELRHAKWFQARATALQSCVIVIRILRDLCQRVAAWSTIPCWAVELLTEKSINSAGVPLSPGEALRVVLEVISAGVILPSGPGLLDPCEKESVDALRGLTNQAREDITTYAQQALRQVAFRQIHKVLGMEPLPRFNKKLLNRKRRRDNSEVGDGEDGEQSNVEKKDKKEEAVTSMETDIKQEATT